MSSSAELQKVAELTPWQQERKKQLDDHAAIMQKLHERRLAATAKHRARKANARKVRVVADTLSVGYRRASMILKEGTCNVSTARKVASVLGQPEHHFLRRRPRSKQNELSILLKVPLAASTFLDFLEDQPSDLSAGMKSIAEWLTSHPPPERRRLRLINTEAMLRRVYSTHYETSEPAVVVGELWSSYTRWKLDRLASSVAQFRSNVRPKDSR